MTNFAADDFAAIRARMAEINDPKAHRPDVPICTTCEGGGWEAYGIGRGDPHFRVCTACGNPEDLPSP